MNRELILYGRRFACYDQHRAIHFLEAQDVPYRFIDIGADREAAQRVEAWVGYRSVPTLVVARPGEVVPHADPVPRDPTKRTRGQDRGTLIVEPSDAQLEAFLRQNGLL